jgi:hypothetical protein
MLGIFHRKEKTMFGMVGVLVDEEALTTEQLLEAIRNHGPYVVMQRPDGQYALFNYNNKDCKIVAENGEQFEFVNA